MKENLALELRLKGYTYRQIAEEMTNRGYPTKYQYAHELVTKAIQKVRTECQESADQIREMELARLDACCKAITDKIEKGDLYAIDRMLRIQARRSALLGLDAPVQTQVNMGVQQELEAALNKLQEKLPASVYEQVITSLAEIDEANQSQ